MKTKRVLNQESPQSTDETVVPEMPAPRKRRATGVPPPTAKVPKPLKSRARPSATKVQAHSDQAAASEPAPSSSAVKLSAKAPNAKAPKPAQKSLGKTAAPSTSPVAAKTSSRSPARSPAPKQTRKPSRGKPSTRSSALEPALRAEVPETDRLLNEQASETTAHPAQPPEPTASEKVAPTAATQALVNDAELWEQGDPIRNRIAQLRTRNSLLEEQLQRLRPHSQVRGKKK